MMNDPARAPLWAALQAELLFLSALLIGWYLLETRKMRVAAERQVEAGFRPAVILTFNQTMNLARVENIGKGPAMEVKWSLKESDLAGTFSYLQQGAPEYLSKCNDRELFQAAEKTGDDVMNVVVHCSYRSLSGHAYSSTATCNLQNMQFNTTFSED